MTINEELYIYDRNMNFLGVIDSYKSLRWRRKYFEAGEFEIHLPASKRNISLLSTDNIISREQSEEAGIIQTINIVENEEKTELIIMGNFLSYLLYRRIIKKKITFKGSITDGMRKLLGEMRPFKILTIEDTDIKSDDIDFQCTYKNVYKRISKLSKASGIGFKIVPDFKNKKLIFKNYSRT